MTAASASLQNGEYEPLLPSDTAPPYQTNGFGNDPERQNSKHDSLPPTDKSKEAWLFLMACWIIEAFVFGFGLSFGVFQDFYHSHEPFAGSDNIAAIGTTTMGFLYMGTPFIIGLCRLFPRSARWFTLMGTLLASLAIALSSLCHNIPQLIATQGALFGINGCFAFCPCIIYIDQWFIERKSLALGIMFSAGGFGGVVFPPLLNLLLEKLGFRMATTIWAALFFGFTVPVAFFIKPRLPYSYNDSPNFFNLGFTKSRVFLLYQFTNFVQATGYFLPGIYLPLYARVTLGATETQAVVALMLLNLTTTLGCVIMGELSDRLHPTTCASISALGATVAVPLVWGLSTSVPGLYIFCILYGLFAGGWPSIWPGVMAEISEKSEEAGYEPSDSMMVYSLLVLGRGVGNVISGPLSDLLIKHMPWKGQFIGGYGSGFGAMIVYTAATGLFSGTNILWERAGML